MKLAAVSILILTAVLLAQTQGPRRSTKKAPSKAPAVESYDPNHLGPGEVACGREQGASACKCMEHRVKASEAAQLECERISDRKERAICMVSNEACAIVPVDVDHAGWENGERMPSQCKRSCSKARCECCKS